jgi:phosphoribosylformylglycinamidine synthase subunit PurSL
MIRQNYCRELNMARSIFTIITKGYPKLQIFWVDHERAGLTPEEIKTLIPRISDGVDQTLLVNIGPEFLAAMEQQQLPLYLVHKRPGVTDNPAKSFQELLHMEVAFQHEALEVHAGVLAHQDIPFNPLIEEKRTFTSLEQLYELAHMDFSLGIKSEINVREYPLAELTDEQLLRLSQEHCWALSLEEMKIIQSHFAQASVKAARVASGLSAAPTDVEIEMLAQTWSEHCKHKIFSAVIDYQDKDQKMTVPGLFKECIKKPTYALNRPWAVSLFDDNAGVVRFREGLDVCIKVETHNSPSALDPYGGALTGILGVNRDIMGTGLGAKPVANTNVFCVGMPDEDQLPAALKHPTEILAGIHHGVMDGGNKSGIPTVNGAIYFDESYSGKPLVYCGTVGVIPPKIQDRDACHKGQRPGDLVVMVGGAVGLDGIHGATASSLVMDKSTTIGMVQIGDPFTQKRVMDFMLAARDRLLYNSLTDNGAGGLSSSVGEMAQATNGARLNLETVPLKYPGLTPWQILVSESQERMTLSVPPEQWAELHQLAQLYQVEATVVGEFTADGKFTCLYQGKTVCQLDLSFLHDGLPKMQLTARWEPRPWQSWKQVAPKSMDLNQHNKVLAGLLSHPSIASKEKWVRQYDHEVQGATAVKPFEGLGNQTAPNDAGVLWYGAYGMNGKDGFAVASGLCPHFSMDDTYLMSKLAVDESVRNLLCHGADPDKIALVDNFCWPDPTPSERNPDAEFKLGQLVRSCLGLKEMVETYGMPLVSGKDSMKNDYHGEKLKISVLPTLLITALGHVPDVTQTPKSHAEVGSVLYRVGRPDYQQYFGHFLHTLHTMPRNNLRDFNWSGLRSLYQDLHRLHGQGLISSMHDLSEGGFLVALFETLLLNTGGVKFDVPAGADPLAYLYSELPGHFIISVRAEDQKHFEAGLDASLWQHLGEVNTSGEIQFGASTIKLTEMTPFWRQA